MEGISDIKIVGIDEKRPPKIRKEPYIDLYFKLSHKAPEDWCKDFNALMSKHSSKPRIKEKEGLYIDTWVKTPDDIVPLLELLKGKITECNNNYIKRIEDSIHKTNRDNDLLSEEMGEQGRLNRIIASLVFENNMAMEQRPDHGV